MHVYLQEGVAPISSAWPHAPLLQIVTHLRQLHRIRQSRLIFQLLLHAFDSSACATRPTLLHDPGKRRPDPDWRGKFVQKDFIFIFIFTQSCFFFALLVQQDPLLCPLTFFPPNSPKNTHTQNVDAPFFTSRAFAVA
jgi:hypothetical protein